MTSMRERMIKTVLALVLGACCVIGARAQGVRDALSGEKGLEKLLGAETLDKQLQQLQLPKETAALFSDGTVDPAKYYVGPYDVLLLTIWQPINQMAVLTVTPECKLVVPRVGEFNAKGKSLESVRAEVMARLQTRISATVEASLSLYKPRSVLVQVLGQVSQPGSYVVSATSRASMVIQLANAPPKEAASMTMLEAERKVEQKERERNRSTYFGPLDNVDFSLRHIVLRHNDGTSQNVDLQKFLARNDEQLNPMLREGDVLYLSPKRPDRGNVSIYGAVHQPGTYEFVEGDSLSTLIAMAFGLTENADGERVTLQRGDASGRPVEVLRINVTDILARTSPDIALRAGDALVLGEKTVRTDFGAVVVRGEVMHPSMYGITRGKTTLREAIRMAGMFTPDANVAAGYVLRRMLAPDGKDIDQRESGLRAYMNSPLTIEDTLNFSLQSRYRSGMVVVDFHRLFEQGDTLQDVTLEDGDEIIVPRNSNQVYVYGQVHRPGFVTFAPGQSVDYYLRRAGGAEESAQAGKTRVISGTTHSWSEPDRAVILPGDQIYVPKFPDISAAVREQSTGNLFLAASVIATLAGVVVQYVLWHK